MRNANVVVSIALAGLVACGDNLQGNRPPVAADSNVSTPEDTPVSITVNVSDPDDDELTFTFSEPEHGTVTQDGGTITYRPDDDYNGADAIHVVISDGTYEVDAEISINVTPVNDAPVAVDDALAGNEDQQVVVTGTTLASNDEDVEGDVLTVTEVANPSVGTVALVSDTITYVPPADFAGSATFEYTVSDGAASDVGLVTITIGGVNDPPVAVTDTVTTAEDTPATITAAELVANDTDAEMQSLSVTAVSSPVNGTVMLAGATITFTPTLNFNGAASFSYTVSDGAATAIGTVNVTVTPVNDAPVANAQSTMVDEDASVTITLTGSDVENSDLTFSIVTPPTAGTLGTITPVGATSATVVYTPTGNSTADDSFTFRVNDGDLDSAPATVTVDVVPQNDAPVANATSAMVDEDSSVTITLTGSDVDGDPLTFATAAGPAAGTLSSYTQVSPTSATVVYTPTANSSADDSFTFTVNDGTADSAPATVTIDVVPQNDPPVADAQSVTVDEDNSIVIIVTGSDIDGDSLTFATATGPTSGTLGAYTMVSATSASVTYTPDDNFNGSDSFTFTASDAAGASPAATVSITVNPIDDPPVAMPGMTTTNEDTLVTITLVGADAEGQALTFSIVDDPIRGTLGAITPGPGNTATVDYTPIADSDQDDSFTFRVTAGGVDSAPALFTIDVVPVNDDPVAVDDTDTVERDTDLIRLATFYSDDDTDIDGPGPLTITAVSNPVNGTVSLVTGTITFTPTPGFVGLAGFDYTLSDGGTGTDTGHVAITVIETNTPPVAVDDLDDVDEDTDLVRQASFYLGNDIDPDPQTLTIVSVSAAVNGIVDLTGTTITFSPAPDYHGPASFQYTVSDGIAQDVGQVNITVNPVNDPPVAVTDNAMVLEDAAATPIDVLGNDTNDDGPVTVTAFTQPANGTATLDAGMVSYQPDADFNGSDTFTYTIEDLGGLTATGTVNVLVLPLNDTPVAMGQTVTMNENTVLTLTLTATDIDVPAQQLTFAVGTSPTQGALGAIVSTSLTSATVDYTPAPDYVGADSFTFTATDGVATSLEATVSITVNNVVVCNDGLVESPEECDDQGNAPGDGCSPECLVEEGWDCGTDSPSACEPICGDGFVVVGVEECDDDNDTETDGCTSECQKGIICTVAAFADGDRFATNPANGNCYVSFDTEQTTFADAQLACLALNGHLVSITSAAEQAIVESVHNTAENPWIGLADEIVEGSFGWVTGETVSYTNWDMNQPDGANDDGEDCVNLNSTVDSPSGTAGRWNDTGCTFIGFTDGRICEMEPNPCGDGIVDSGAGEQCDDGNEASFDGCSSTCQIEPGAVCSGTCSKLVINEVEYDNQGTDNMGGQFEYIEIYNVGTAPADVNNIALILVNLSSLPGSEYFIDGTNGVANVAKRLRLNTAGVPENLLPPGGMIVIAPAALSLPPTAFRITFAPITNGNLQNGAPDAFTLFDVGSNTIVDTLLYEGAAATANFANIPGGPYAVNEGPGHMVGDPAPSGGAFESLQRFPNGRDTQSNAADFALRAATPGLPNL